MIIPVFMTENNIPIKDSFIFTTVLFSHHLKKSLAVFLLMLVRVVQSFQKNLKLKSVIIFHLKDVLKSKFSKKKLIWKRAKMKRIRATPSVFCKNWPTLMLQHLSFALLLMHTFIKNPIHIQHAITKTWILRMFSGNKLFPVMLRLPFFLHSSQ